MASVKIIGKVAVKVMPDTSEFKDRLKQDLEKIEREMKALKIDIIPEISKASKEKVEAEMKRLAEKLSGENVHFDLGLNEAEVAQVESALDALARTRTAKINVDVDKNKMRAALDSLLMLGGARPQLDAIRQSIEKLRDLDYISISVGNLATKVTTLGGAALAASGHLFSIGGGLAQIGWAALPVPGILGGIAIGMGTTIAAFKDFNEYVPQVEGYMSRLQDTISANFWEQASAQINAFVDGVFPILLSNLRTTSTELGKFWGSFAEALGTNLNPALNTMFADLRESIRIATEHTDSFAQIITVLGQIGASYLPRMAEWFTNMTENLATFLQTNLDNGNLQAWADQGIDNLQALGSVVASTAEIFHGFYTAASAAGGATLQSLAAGLSNIAGVVQSAGFQSGLTSVFETAFGMMERITNLAGPGLEAAILSLVDVFNTVGPAISGSIGLALGELFTALASPPVASGLLAIFDGIEAALENLRPAIAPTIGMLASLGPVIGALLTQITAIGAQGIDKLAPTFTGIANALVPVIEKLGGFISGVLADLTPVFQKMGENVIKLVQKFPALVDAVQGLWDVLSPILIPVLKVVADIIGGALMGVLDGAIMLFEGLTKIVSGAVDVLTGIWDVIAGLFTFDFDRVGEGFGSIFSGLGQIIVGALQGAAGALWAWLNGSLFGFFRSFVTKIVGGLGGSVGGALSTTFSTVGTVVRTAFEVIGKIIGTSISVIVTIFKTAGEVFGLIFKGAWDVIAAIFSGAFTVIKTLVTSVWGGISTFFRTSMEGLYFLFKGPWDAISEFLLGLWTTIKATAMLIWDGLRTWFNTFLQGWRVRIEDAWTAIRSKTVEVWEAIRTKIADTWEAIKSKVTDTINNVKSKMSEVWEAVKTKVNDIWEGIKTKIKDTWDDIKNAVTEKVNAVKEKVSGTWDDIKSTVTEKWENIKSTIGQKWEDIKSKVAEKAGEIKQKVADTWEDIKSALVTAWETIKTKIGEKVGDAADEAGKLPGKALEALGDIGGKLFASGQALIQGFIDGITNKFEAAKGVVSGGLQKLRNLFPFSPAKEGPFSGTGYTTYSGRALMTDFAKGMDSVRNKVLGTVTSIHSEVSDALNENNAFEFDVKANLDTSNLNMSAISGVTSTVNSAVSTAPAETGSISIDNITIPLEDLKQLKTLEEFLDMLRVRTRQGVIA